MGQEGRTEIEEEVRQETQRGAERERVGSTGKVDYKPLGGWGQKCSFVLTQN